MRGSVRARATVVATAAVALALGMTASVLVWILSLAATAQDAAQPSDQAVGQLPGTVAPEPDVLIPESPAPGLDLLRPMLFVSVPVLLLLVAGLTWAFMGRALAPVTAIRREFTEITASDLHRRVPVPATRDEVAWLATAMNATLERLERAVQQHRRFVADAAHELRSPLATLRTRLELARPSAPEVVRESLVDVDRVQALATDLLLLARLDAGEPVRIQEVDLGQVAAETAAEAAIRSARHDVRLTLDIAPDVVLTGSRTHLARMVANLVDNALRHASSQVIVRVTGSGVEVLDDGPGVPATERERVFDRFTRLDEARARDAGGSGLGLAIARDIARAHGGTLFVTEAGPWATGACFRALLLDPRVIRGVGSGHGGRSSRERKGPAAHRHRRRGRDQPGHRGAEEPRRGRRLRTR